MIWILLAVFITAGIAVGGAVKIFGILMWRNIKK